MKKLLIATLFCTTQALASGLPVIDGAAQTQWISTIQQQLKDAQTLLNQLETQKLQLESITGYKGFGELIISSVNDDIFEVLSGSQYQKILSDIDNLGVGALNTKAKTIYDEMGFSEQCTNTDDVFKDLCEKKGALTAASLASYDDIMEKSIAQAQEIVNKSQKIMQTQDTKAIQEFIASSQTEMQLINMQFQTLQQIRQFEEQKKDYYNKQVIKRHNAAQKFGD